jgi:type II secretory pathway pseudopilin PulG
MRRPRSDERAFTLVEVLAATALWTVLGGALLYVTQTLIAQTREIAAQQAAYVQLTHLTETWDAESSSALAIFIPPSDVLGDDNADGHELDFYSRDAARYGHFWAYRWDRASAALQRYTYAAPGAPAAQSDPPVLGITNFAAIRKLASTLRQPFLGGYAPRDVAVNFGYPGVDGGNAVIEVTVANARTAIDLELLPGTMTSGFSIVVATFTPAPAPTSVATPQPTPVPTPSPIYRITTYASGGSLWPCIHLGLNVSCTTNITVGQQCDVSYDGGASWSLLFYAIPAVKSCP